MEKNNILKGSLADKKDKSRLGRGLSALLPPAKPAAAAQLATDTPIDLAGTSAFLPPEASLPSVNPGVEQISIRSIVPNALQPRQIFDPAALDDLATSVQTHGVLQPVMVRPLGGERYELVAGERRFRAAEKAGLTTIPAIVRGMTDEESLVVALIENIQREDLNSIEAARGYRQLLEQFSLTQVELAQQIGKSQPTIANALGLLRLPEDIQDSISSGQISGEHGRVLLSVREKEHQFAAWRQAIDQHLSVKELRAAVSQALQEKDQVQRPIYSSQKDIHWQNLEDKLRAALGMKVGIKLGREGRGTLTIEFSDADEIEYLLEKIHPAL